MVNVRDMVRECEGRLEEAGVVSSRAEAEWLLAASLGLGRTELYLRQEPLETAAQALVYRRLARRCRGESLQYVLGDAICLGHRVRVRSGVFIPRPETEVLIEAAIGFLRARLRAGIRTPRVLEVGVGSGAIAIALARAAPSCVIVGVELSYVALTAAAANVAANGVRRRVRLLQGDWTQAVRGVFDLVISNPPYVPSGEVDRLMLAGGDEPRMSLDGGADGMMFHRRLIEDAPRLLTAGGALCMECAEDQARATRVDGRRARH
jgi:release factor glutamine methyltransferase